MGGIWKKIDCVFIDYMLKWFIMSLLVVIFILWDISGFTEEAIQSGFGDPILTIIDEIFYRKNNKKCAKKY